MADDAARDAQADPVDRLLKLLDLTDLSGAGDLGGSGDAPGSSEARSAHGTEDIFIGQSQPQPGGRVFGGQVLAQSIIAAARTVPEDRLIHSMHGYFLRAGDAAQPIRFGVQRLRDGRSFSARRSHAYQNDEPILSMIASFQLPDQSVEHQDPMPTDVPDPESLPSTADLIGNIKHPAAQAWAFGRAFDIRHITAPVYLNGDTSGDAINAVWMKTSRPLPDNETLHRAALAYASDYTLLEPILRRHSLAWTTPGMSVASLDHAMWWFRPVRVDDWLLYTQISPNASGARGLSMGRIYNRSGDLVASVAQEGMVRVPAVSA